MSKKNRKSAYCSITNKENSSKEKKSKANKKIREKINLEKNSMLRSKKNPFFL